MPALLFAACVICVAYLVIMRVNEIFFLSIRDGKALLVRGTCPSQLFHDLEDVMRRANVAHASIRAVKADGHARLITTGVDDSVAQRCRNAFGIHPLHQMRSETSGQRRNLGQILGFAWLAWLLASLG